MNDAEREESSRAIQEANERRKVNKTRYKLTIEKSEVIETVTRREWVKGGPDGRKAQEEYGYTPQIPMITTETVTVLEMRFSELDVAQLTGAALDYGKVC